ncbi:Protein kinase-like domain [Pseudocohnilembus persalinus]|uniref:Protein kinase-like domain n=1 Tax=Pseudocohnilembus persalinus TaxID=266149 RepID=A0A0V0QBR4_PSEPJ|nr:Protein kinase-like domain [Pseudocohnilembus persalinus]|eukprot:KRW99594.1 Protein kinase-like domain [Pseudocohnilembus persalinus]
MNLHNHIIQRKSIFIDKYQFTQNQEYKRGYFGQVLQIQEKIKPNNIFVCKQYPIHQRKKYDEFSQKNQQIIGIVHQNLNQVKELYSYLDQQQQQVFQFIQIQNKCQTSFTELIENQEVIHEIQILNYLEQALQGLKFLKDMGMNHNDIKPSNILLNGDTIILSDYYVQDVEQYLIDNHLKDLIEIDFEFNFISPNLRNFAYDRQFVKEKFIQQFEIKKQETLIKKQQNKPVFSAQSLQQIQQEPIKEIYVHCKEKSDIYSLGISFLCLSLSLKNEDINDINVPNKGQQIIENFISMLNQRNQLMLSEILQKMLNFEENSRIDIVSAIQLIKSKQNQIQQLEQIQNYVKQHQPSKISYQEMNADGQEFQYRKKKMNQLEFRRWNFEILCDLAEKLYSRCTNHCPKLVKIIIIMLYHQ